MNFFVQRRYRKMVKHLLHESRHARHMREDIAAPSALERLAAAEEELQKAWATRNPDTVEEAGNRLVETIHGVMPPRSHPKLRENVEIAVVAISVAMAFRTFFIQPFKIPTGSMQPTLYGVTAQPPASVPLFDKLPFSLVGMALFGEVPLAMRAATDGVLYRIGHAKNHPGDLVLGIKPDGRLKVKKLDATIDAVLYSIGNFQFAVPEEFEMLVQDGDRVTRDQPIARGRTRLGDHIFVDKVRYNFLRPKRGDVIVFDTNAIDDPRIRKDTFYIKRLVGLSGEAVSIRPPYLYVNGKRIEEPYPFERLVKEADKGYNGYQMPRTDANNPAQITPRHDTITVGPGEFLPFGDNTLSSLDGRYFGSVSQDSLVGPSFFVYWPFTKRWGFSR